MFWHCQIAWEKNRLMDKDRCMCVCVYVCVCMFVYVWMHACMHIFFLRYLLIIENHMLTCDMLLDGWRKPDFLHPNTFVSKSTFAWRHGDIDHVSRKLLLFTGNLDRILRRSWSRQSEAGANWRVERVELFFLWKSQVFGRSLGKLREKWILNPNEFPKNCMTLIKQY